MDDDRHGIQLRGDLRRGGPDPAHAGHAALGLAGSTTRTDTDLRATFAVDRVPTGNGIYLDVTGRRVGTNNEYRAQVLLRPPVTSTSG